MIKCYNLKNLLGVGDLYGKKGLGTRNKQKINRGRDFTKKNKMNLRNNRKVGLYF